jgi:hypothetical protein
LDINYLAINLSFLPYAGGCKDRTTPRRTLIQRPEGDFIVSPIPKNLALGIPGIPSPAAPEIPRLGNLPPGWQN